MEGATVDTDVVNSLSKDQIGIPARKNKFQAGNNIRSETAARKKMRIESGELITHPVQRPKFKPLMRRKKSDFRIDDESIPEFKAEVCEFLQSIKGQPCRDTRRNEDTKCDCLHRLNNETDGKFFAKISDAIVTFFNLPKATHKIILFERVKSAIDIVSVTTKSRKNNSNNNLPIKGKVFILCILDGKPLELCSNAFQRLFDVGPHQVDTLKKKYLEQKLYFLT